MATHEDQTGSSLPTPRLAWVTRRMGTRVDLADKEALYTVLDEDRQSQNADGSDRIDPESVQP